jgi:hypothetical protein
MEPNNRRRVNWARVAAVIYDKFEGEFAPRSVTYAQHRNRALSMVR